MDTIFNLSNLVVMPFWLLMIILPRWRWTERIMKSLWVIVPPALIYAALVLPQFGTVLAGVANPTLDGIAQFLGDPSATTAAWAHFLAFDLFVGRWIYLDSREHHLHPLLTAPALFFTLMLGPVGFLLYVLLKTAVLRRRPQQQVSTA